MSYPPKSVTQPAIIDALGKLANAVRVALDNNEPIPCANMGAARWAKLTTDAKIGHCHTCPVIAQCGAMGAADPHAVGVWGGARIKGRKEMS